MSDEPQKPEVVQPIGKDEQNPSSPVTAVSYMDDVAYHAMAEFFNVSYQDRHDDHLAGKLSLLSDWAAKKSGSTDRLEQQMALKNLIRGLGFAQTGKELIDRLYRYTRLDQDRKRIEAKMDLLL